MGLEGISPLRIFGLIFAPTLNDKMVMQDVSVEKGFAPPMCGPEEGHLRLQKSPHNVMTTFRNVFIREL